MATYYIHSGATGAGTGADWSNAYTSITALSGKTHGDVFFLAHDHNEVSGITLNVLGQGTVDNPQKLICVNRLGSFPPVSADRRATARIGTATNLMGAFGNLHYDGIIFNPGQATAGDANLNVGGTAGEVKRFDNCSLRLSAPGVNSNITSSAQYLEFNNTTLQFNNVAQGIQVQGTMRWRNTPNAILGTIPTTLFKVPSTNNSLDLECTGVDFSALGAGKTIFGVISGQSGLHQSQRLHDCKLDPAVTIGAVPLGPSGGRVDVTRSGAAGLNYTFYRLRTAASMVGDTAVVRTGGNTDGTTPLSWKIDTLTRCSYSIPFECPPLAVWNEIVGSPMTATVEGIAATLPNNDEIWLELEYQGSLIGSIIDDAKPDLLTPAAPQATSTEVWSGSTVPFKLDVTFTPAQKGWVYARVKVGKPSSTFYIDPTLTLGVAA